MIIYKSPDEIDKMRRAGRDHGGRDPGVLERVAPGVTTADLDAIAERTIRDAGGTPSFLHYKGSYPATICASVNDEIVHGIPSRDARAARPATSCRSTAGPSGRASTGTPPSP